MLLGVLLLRACLCLQRLDRRSLLSAEAGPVHAGLAAGRHRRPGPAAPRRVLGRGAHPPCQRRLRQVASLRRLALRRPCASKASPPPTTGFAGPYLTDCLRSQLACSHTHMAQLVHATASNPAGPYEFADVAVPPSANNPQVHYTLSATTRFPGILTLTRFLWVQGCGVRSDRQVIPAILPRHVPRRAARLPGPASSEHRQLDPVHRCPTQLHPRQQQP